MLKINSYCNLGQVLLSCFFSLKILSGLSVEDHYKDYGNMLLFYDEYVRIEMNITHLPIITNFL